MHPLGTSGYFFGKLITLASEVRSDGIVYDKDMYLFWVTDYGAPGVPPPPWNWQNKVKCTTVNLNYQLSGN